MDKTEEKASAVEIAIDPKTRLFHGGRLEAGKNVENMLRHIKLMEGRHQIGREELAEMAEICELVHKASKKLTKLQKSAP